MGDAVRLAAESLGISDVFRNILIPLAPRTALVCTILKKTTTYLWFMECNSIPGHPLGFSPSVSGLPNFGMLDRSLCSAVSAKRKSGFRKREFWNSQSVVSNTQVPEVLQSAADQHLHIRRASRIVKPPR